MRALVPVHGGLDAPVDRILPLSRRHSLITEAAGLPKIAVNKADLATLYRFADGTLSPLAGPMTKAEYDLVLAEQVVVSNGKRYAWTIPLSLPVTDDEAAAIKVGQHVALVGPEGLTVGVLQVKSLFDWDKATTIEKVYRTKRTDHPGAKIYTEDPRTKLVGGEIQVLPPTPHPVYGHQVLSPIRTRALIADRKWEKALAFQTRNPLHRAHEYALVYGIEELTRQGAYAGVVLNPLVGELKGDDVDAETRMRCYNELVQKRLLGQGDSDSALWAKVGYAIHEVFELVGLDIKMHYGGPSEAVMHAIYRQNHGFSHIVVGRKHADAPYDDGTPIWGDFDAQEIFANLPGELHTQQVKVGFAAFYESVNRVDLMDAHPNEKPVFISGTKVRSMLVAGEHPDPRILRPEIADILIASYRSRGA